MSTFRGSSKSSNPPPVSTVYPPPAPLAASVQGLVADPSMEDIFADIRRTLAEEDGPRPQTQTWPDSSETAPYGAPANRENNVVVLDNSMAVTAPAAAAPEPVAPAPKPAPAAPAVTAALVASDVASDSVTTLVRSMVAARTSLVSGIAEPVENIVRDTVRTLIKEWLDANLPQVIERVARVEIDRMLSGAA